MSFMDAMKGSADQIELCSSLNDGSMMPLAGLMQAASQNRIHCHPMIRPLADVFNCDPHDIEIMAQDISNAHFDNLSDAVRVVENGSVNLDKKFGSLKDGARGLNTTLHSVAGEILNRLRTINQAIERGFERILTSSGW